MKQLIIIFFLSISAAAFAVPANKQHKKTARKSPAHAFDLKKIDLDVADLPRGVYYLHLGFGSKKDNQVDKIRILLN